MTGYANSGEILAIMGASGAGKTTLLNILSYRIEKRSKKNVLLEGEILANCKPYDSDMFGKFAAYVM